MNFNELMTAGEQGKDMNAGPHQVGTAGNTTRNIELNQSWSQMFVFFVKDVQRSCKGLLCCTFISCYITEYQFAHCWGNVAQLQSNF